MIADKDCVGVWESASPLFRKTAFEIDFIRDCRWLSTLGPPARVAAARVSAKIQLIDDLIVIDARSKWATGTYDETFLFERDQGSLWLAGFYVNQTKATLATVPSGGSK